MDHTTGFRIHFRVRFGKTLSTQNTSLDTYFDGRAITIKSDNDNQPLSEAEWVVLSVRGFSTEAEAQEFGEKLRTAMEIAALSTRLGIDTGQDEKLSYFNPDVLRSAGILGPDESPVPHIHGLAVSPDKEQLLARAGPLKLGFGIQPAALTDAITALSGQSLAIQPAFIASLRLFNLAVVSTDRHAQIVLAFSAVEAAAQGPSWTQRQREFITQQAEEIETNFPNSEEHSEISEAIRRLHHRSLRQSVIRLLRENNLDHLKRQWDNVYARRSAVVHGERELSKQEMNDLANDAIKLCRKIILDLVRQEGIQLPPNAE